MIAMRMTVLMVALILSGGFKMCSRVHPNTASLASSAAPVSSMTAAKVNFDKQIKHILQARCQPCHFPGGKVYDRMPFDRPETIKTLGTKLFTRIKDEDERRVIREFLSQP